MVDPLLLTFVAPIVVIVASAIGLRFGFPFGSPFHLMPLFSWWPGILHEGVQQSCLIAESECIGATATVYIVSGFWFMAVVTLIASAALEHLAGGFYVDQIGADKANAAVVRTSPRSSSSRSRLARRFKPS